MAEKTIAEQIADKSLVGATVEVTLGDFSKGAAKVHEGVVHTVHDKGTLAGYVEITGNPRAFKAEQIRIKV